MEVEHAGVHEERGQRARRDDDSLEALEHGPDGDGGVETPARHTVLLMPMQKQKGSFLDERRAKFVFDFCVRVIHTISTINLQNDLIASSLFYWVQGYSSGQTPGPLG